MLSSASSIIIQSSSSSSSSSLLSASSLVFLTLLLCSKALGVVAFVITVMLFQAIGVNAEVAGSCSANFSLFTPISISKCVCPLMCINQKAFVFSSGFLTMLCCNWYSSLNIIWPSTLCKSIKVGAFISIVRGPKYIFLPDLGVTKASNGAFWKNCNLTILFFCRAKLSTFCIRSKETRSRKSGTKIWEKSLCKSNTNHLWSSFINSGKDISLMSFSFTLRNSMFELILLYVSAFNKLFDIAVSILRLRFMFFELFFPPSTILNLTGGFAVASIQFSCNFIWLIGCCSCCVSSGELCCGLTVNCCVEIEAGTDATLFGEFCWTVVTLRIGIICATFGVDCVACVWLIFARVCVAIAICGLVHCPAKFSFFFCSRCLCFTSSEHKTLIFLVNEGWLSGVGLLQANVWSALRNPLTTQCDCLPCITTANFSVSLLRNLCKSNLPINGILSGFKAVIFTMPMAPGINGIILHIVTTKKVTSFIFTCQI